MSKKFIVGETYTTRCGDKVTIYATNMGGDYPIHAGIVSSKTGDSWAETYTKDGLVDIDGTERPEDIVSGSVEIEGRPVLCANNGDEIPSMGMYTEEDGVLSMDDNGKVVKKYFNLIVFLDEGIENALEIFSEFKKDTLDESEHECEETSDSEDTVEDEKSDDEEEDMVEGEKEFKELLDAIFGILMNKARED